MKPYRYLILVTLCILAVSFFGCQASMQKNKPAQRLVEKKLLIIPTDGSEPSEATYTYYESTESQTVQQDPCDEIYGPLVALGPFLIDNCSVPPHNPK